MRRSPLASFRTRHVALAAVVLAGLAVDAPALAQHDKALAESLFQAGRDLMAAGKAEQACPKFAESQRADPSAGTMLNLARCHETIGRTASAWAEYKEAATLARNANRQEQADAAQKLADALEPKVSKLEIEAVDTPGLQIKRDGEPMGKGSLGVALAIDPGEHTIEASAAGYKPFSTKVTVGKEKDLQKVQIPALEKLPPEEIAAQGSQGGSTQPGAPAATGSSGMRTAGIVMAGVGVVGLGLGTVFGIMASGDVSGAKDDPKLCPDSKCTPEGRAQIDSAGTKATVSTIGFIGGGVLLAGGAALFLLSGSKSPAKQEQASTHVIPSLGPQGGGLSFVGKF